ncbi:glycosyltransferase [Leptolyngbya sp. GB1-A1]|uniref:glycosyltransferase n=1 Tax=Leptolyngbya sp. GB1-A1 TaxID=2933908 RepID=UPI0032982E5A
MDFQRRTTKPTVSLVVSDLSKSGAGRWGGGVRPFLLAQALRQLGHRVEIFGFGDDPAIAYTVDLPIVTIAPTDYPKFFQSARHLMKQIDGDIIYAYKPKPTSFGISLLHRLKTRRPLILDIDDWELSWHGGEDWKYCPTLKQFARDVLKPKGALRQPDHPLYLSWIEKLVSRANAVTVHTQFLQHRFGGTCVPNGKDISLFDPQRYDAQAAKQHFGLSDYRVLMFPGAPRPYKGVEDILMALEQLNQPDLRLVIVGGSPYDDYDSHLMQRWGQWLIKLPALSHEKMPEAIAASDIVVVPQRDTPAAQAQFPLKLTDGMAMAKPILATRVGDIPQILGNTGYLVDSSSPTQLAAEITHIFANLAEAIDRGRRARERCREHYSLEAMSHRLAPVLENC